MKEERTRDKKGRKKNLSERTKAEKRVPDSFLK
jgi:hypothetical protein